MACSRPLHITPKVKYNGDYFYARSYDVPCGYCLNCRRDAQNYVIDRANYEYSKRLTASFVTVTYDDIHLIEHCAVLDENDSLIFDLNSKNDPVVRTTLNYKDFTGFVDNIRHYIKNHPEIQNMLCQPDFSYLYCGEYGDCFNRCHAHFLFFGLDFAYCKKIFMDKWKNGFIDVLPVLDGAIRYVCKYMDKFEKGILAQLKYDFKGMARPRLRMSQGFGQGLLWNNAEDIIENDYCYKAFHNIRRPISAYWKSLLTGNCPFRDKTRKDFWSKAPEYLERKNAAVVRSLADYGYTEDNCNVDSELVQNAFRLRLARVRERNIEIQLQNSHIPVPTNFHIPMQKKFSGVTYDWQQIKRSPPSILRALAMDYLEELLTNLPPSYTIIKEA